MEKAVVNMSCVSEIRLFMTAYEALNIYSNRGMANCYINVAEAQKVKLLTLPALHLGQMLLQ